MYNPTELMQSILTSESAQRIIDRISPVYGEARVFLWLLQAVGIALDYSEGIKDDFDIQSLVAKATWSLMYYEEQYGVTKNSSLTLEQRRQNVFAAMRFKAPLNPTKVASIMSALAQSEVSIEENTGKNRFKVTAVPSTPYIKRAVEFLDKAKPAHTIYWFDVKDDAISEEPYCAGFHAITVPLTVIKIGTNILSEQSWHGGFHAQSVPVPTVDFGGPDGWYIIAKQKYTNGFHHISIPVTSVDFGGVS